MRGNHAAADAPSINAPRRRLSIPVDLPFSFVNRMSARMFNNIHYRTQWRTFNSGMEHYEHFFFPLDGIRHWNRIYGPRGFLQYQCAVPADAGRSVLGEILNRGAHGGIDSFFGVLKVFGDRRSPGLMSFPRPGATVALDFYNHGDTTLHLLNSFDDIVLSAGGRVNPYKDARMSGDSYRRYYPRWQELESFRDPKFSSGFWRRVTRG